METARGWIPCVGGVYNWTGMLQKLRSETSRTFRRFIDLRRAVSASRQGFDEVYEETDGFPMLPLHGPHEDKENLVIPIILRFPLFKSFLCVPMAPFLVA